jgi:hypothetical protein
VSPTPDAAATPSPGGGPGDQPTPRRRQSIRGLILTMVVVGGFAVALWALAPQPSGLRQPVVDVAVIARQAPARLGFSPTVPADLPSGWTPTSALVQDGTDGVPTWRINYSTPTGSWASLIQGGHATRAWEGAQIIDGREHGTVVVGGRTWVVRSRPDRDLTAYVLRGPAVTTMIAGRAGPAEFEALIRASRLPAG